MSLPSVLSNRRVKTGSIIALTLGSLLTVATLLAPASGAYFFDTKDGRVTSTTTTLSLGLTGDGAAQSGTLNLEFAGLVPNASQTQSFTIQNTGSIAGHAKLMTQNLALNGVSPGDLTHLTYWVEGYGYLPYTNTENNVLDLGILQPGDERILTIRATLDPDAGNEWQNASVSDDLFITLSQA